MFRFLKKQKISSLLAIIVFSASFLFAFSVLAQVDTGVGFGAGTGLGVEDPRVIIANVIRILLGFLGIMATLIIIYAGWMYMSSQGSEDQIATAKKILLNGIIGLVIILSAFGIASFVLSRLLTATGGIGAGGCLAGEHYCPGPGCVSLSIPCSTLPPAIYTLNSKIVPTDESKNYPMNTIGKIYFNQAVKQNDAYFDSNGGSTEIIATTSRSVSFSSDQTCGEVRDDPVNDALNITVPSGYEDAHCFVPSAESELPSIYKYQIDVSDYEKLSSTASCSVGCDSDFSVTNKFDVTGPNLYVYSTRGMCSGNVEFRARATDDYSISSVGFYIPVELDPTVEVSPSVMTRNFTATTSVNLSDGIYNLSVTATDIAGHSTSTTQAVIIFPDHCCNMVQDVDETGIDCGGSCGSCEGGACAIDMTEDCSLPGNCDDNLCSGYLSCECDPGSVADSSYCEAAGYDVGTTDCCTCQRKPVIDWISPQGGFCDADHDEACVSDDDCASSTPPTCNYLIGNATEDNLITIGGKNFGDSGSVYFSDTGLDTDYHSAGSIISECDTNWTDTQIITRVPAGLADGLDFVKVERTDNSLFDINNDLEWGRYVEFLINDITRPGICKVSNDNSINTVCTENGGECLEGVECLSTGYCNTNYGRTGDTINYYGYNLGSADANFGSFYNSVVATAQGLADGAAGVPMLSNGKTSTFASSTDEKTFSNYLDFLKISDTPTGPRIFSFDPETGKEGQYVTINGEYFGNPGRGVNLNTDTDYVVYFSQNASYETTDVRANFDFPDICADSLWSDNKITLKVSDLGVTAGDYYLIISSPKIKTFGIDYITSVDVLPEEVFDYDPSEPLSAGLCKITPSLGNWGDSLTAYGENFDLFNGMVKFGSNNIDADDWDEIIPEGYKDFANFAEITVPNNAEEGQVKVFIMNQEGSCGSCPNGQECIDSDCYSLSNSDNFTVGSCIVNRIPDSDLCGSNSTCCPMGSMFEDQCISGTSDDCYSQVPSSVYEWEFDTSEGGGIGDPCSSSTVSGVCDPSDEMCGINLECDGTTCTCQMPCDSATTTPTCDKDNTMCNPGMYCDPDSCYCEADSCRGQSTFTEKCEGYCPNTPGECSFADSSTATSTDYSCDSSVDCNTFSGCDGNSCLPNLNIGKCAVDTCSLATTTSDVLGNTISMYCNEYNGGGQWHIKTNLSCPTDWIQLFGNECVDPIATCNECLDGLNCTDDNNNYLDGGVCASSENLCPSGYLCNSDSSSADYEKCEKDVSESCECCCRKGPAYQDLDCCYPLECDGSCGGDAALYGLCSGCANAGSTQTEHDNACICVGHEGQYCDVNASIGGACRDCSLISDSLLCTSASTCCWDASSNNGNGRCSGITVGGDPRDTFTENSIQYCAYYDCDRADPTNPTCGTQTTDASTTGEFVFYNDCTVNCGYEVPVGESCYDEVYGNCGLMCASPYECIGKSGCSSNAANLSASTCVSGDDSCSCCCDPEINNSCDGDGMVDLTCHPDQAPCDTDPSVDPNARGLCCGCDLDSDCGTGTDIIGCSSDTCCRTRPGVDFVDPFNGMATTCRNKLIKVGFSEEMDLLSLNEDNFMLLASTSPDEQCPNGSTYLTLNIKKRSNNIFAKIYYKIVDLTRIAFSPVFGDRAIAANENFCKVDGVVSGLSVNGKGELHFKPSQILDSNRTYYGVIKTDPDLNDGIKVGVLNAWGVSMASSTNVYETIDFNGKNLTNSYIWKFSTLPDDAPNNGLCLVDSLLIKPHNYLFKSYEDDVNDNDMSKGNFNQINTDSDKLYISEAYGEGQLLATSSIYNWTYDWSLTNNLAFESINTPPGGSTLNDDQTWIRVIENIVEAQTRVVSNLKFVNNNDIGDGNPLYATTTAFLFVCDNPWPSIDENGGWSPWRSEEISSLNFNHMLYYCRDSGSDGVYDDLPAMQKNTELPYDYSNARDGELMREVYFPVNKSIEYVSPSFSVKSNGDGTVTANFVYTSGITNYTLYYGTETGNYPYSYSELGSPLFYTLGDIHNIVVGDSYYFNLKGSSTASTSPFLGEIGPITPLYTATSTDEPKNFTVVPGDGELALSWNPVHMADKYNLYFTSNRFNYENSDGSDNNFGQKKEIDKNTTKAVIRNLENGTTYFFGITSVSVGGNESEFIDNATKLEAVPVAPVTDLRINSVANENVGLSWSAVAGTDAYAVYMSTSTKQYIELGTTVTPEYNAVSLINGEKVYFIVKSLGGTSPLFSTSTASNEISATPFMTVIDSSAINIDTVDDNSIEFEWTNLSADGVAGYNIYYKVIDPQEETATSSAIYTIRDKHILSGLTGGTDYNLFVNPVSIDSIEGDNFNNFAATTTLEN